MNYWCWDPDNALFICCHNAVVLRVIINFSAEQKETLAIIFFSTVDIRRSVRDLDTSFGLEIYTEYCEKLLCQKGREGKKY